jgi:hypothetical protein
MVIFRLSDETFKTESDLAKTVSGELKPADELRLAQEIESIQFYVTQGYFELAGKNSRRA